MIRYIYTFFVGLFIAIFIGLGIAVFYEAPKSPNEPVWYPTIGVKQELTDAQKQEEIVFNTEVKEYTKKMQVYYRNVSIIVLVCAVLVLIFSLTLTKYLGVITDGTLLGGVFTLLYGIGVGMATDNNKYRFIVAGVGLAITLLLGYLKFTRQSSADTKKRT